MKSPVSLSRMVTVGALSAVAVASVMLGLSYAPVGNTVSTVLQSPIQAINQFIAPSPESLFGKSRIHVLVVGLDYDYDNLDQETSKSSRSDVLMALNLDTQNRHISELSIPRDMVATLPSGQQAKINQAQSEGGITESQAVVAKWLGITPFDRYIVFRINTAKDVVNEIGGIDLNVENSDALRHQGANGPLNYDDNWGHLHVHLQPGFQHLDGERAVGYARFRHDWCSDPCRIMRQQQLIHAVADKLEHDQFNTFTHLQGLLTVAKRDVDTNLKPNEELSLLMAYAHVKPQDIQTAQVPYSDTIMLPDYGDSLIPDESAKDRLVASMFADPDAAAMRAIRVRIENGTPVPGLAARIGGKLKAKGFTIAELRDASRSDFSTTEIHAMSDDTRASLQVINALGAGISDANISSSQAANDADSQTADVTIVLGKDIIGSDR